MGNADFYYDRYRKATRQCRRWLSSNFMSDC
nr:MAG TPA_asm: Hepatitis E cysteine protease [Caudoviricetes sp.]